MNAKSTLADPRPGIGTLVRPKFSEGLLLNDDDLTAGVDYTRNLSRLMFRSLFGCGVICGLVVDPEFKCEKLYIHVADGLALNCLGDPIEVPSPQTIIVDPRCGVELPDTVWVVLCPHDKCCAPRSTACSCDDTDTPSVCTRIRDGFEIRVLPERPACACGCPPLLPPSDLRTTQDDEVGQDPYTGDTVPRGGHDCWCADPKLPCFQHHYAGDCHCECGDGCDCDCVILARLYNHKTRGWQPDHSVRRFVRPVLMRDPQVVKERQKAVAKKSAIEATNDAAQAARETAEQAKTAEIQAAKADAEARVLRRLSEQAQIKAAEAMTAAKTEAQERTKAKESEDSATGSVKQASTRRKAK